MPQTGQKTVAVVAEKPSVARDIARVLGATQRGQGYSHGNGYVVTWAVGHLVALAEPHQIRADWKRWRRDLLPMLPRDWPLIVYEQTRDQFEVVRRILASPKVGTVVCATDAGREGELIFRYIYEAAKCRKPVERLWISSLTPDAIRKGFRELKAGREYDPLADAAKGRSRADWLVGMNLSRAYSLAYDQHLSVGRVQTPTLAMVVERELAIRNFVPEKYIEVAATFSPKQEGGAADEDARRKNSYAGTYFQYIEKPGAQPAEAGGGTAPSGGPSRETRLPADGEQAGQVVERAKTGEARIESIEEQTKRMLPPLLYDLTELQRHANRLFAFSAKRTLELAQTLYEKHKLITYPRTDSRHLSNDVAATLGAVVDAVAAPYREHLAPGTGSRKLGSRYVDDSKVSDHHAIIPTASPPTGLDRRSDEGKIYDLVCRRLLAAWHEEYITAVTTVITAITSPAAETGGDPIIDRYVSSGTTVKQEGWKVLDLGGGKKPAKKRRPATDMESPSGDGPDEPGDDATLPPGLVVEQPQDVLDIEAIEKQTRPPRRLTEATLLTAMETAGQALDEKELSDAMKERGLGTPATRAAIIETLLKREYILRKGKSLEATDKGIRLIEVVHDAVKSPVMTGEWEAQLRRIERGRGELPAFMEGIEKYVIEVIGQTPQRANWAGTNGASKPSEAPHGRSAPAPPPDDSWDGGDSEPPPFAPFSAQTLAEPPPMPPMAGLLEGPPPSHPAPAKNAASSAAAAVPVRSRSAPQRRAATTASQTALQSSLPLAQPRAIADSARNGSIDDLLKSVFGFSTFRPYQRETCQAVVAGRDVLLVMPTGAGKSLCYQLPGIARGGTTVVVSPLIALMEDQVAKLQQGGLRAERIHSGRPRDSSRQVCLDYLAGELDYLFIAPERLAVPRFPEMLAKRKPALIAVDEAHCISHWGHDFRPEYRMLGERLPMLRPAPVIGLTATATPRVQDDIIEQLGLSNTYRSIHGFRRENIAIEIVEMTPSERTPAVLDLLRDPGRRPAIIYAPTRKKAEAMADELQSEFRSAAYHAGMSAGDRDAVQAAFLADRLEVIVATIAFGMGIDKPNIRTVIHAALPGSVESYYQEIGRAGRDGQPSRAILMHGWVDRKTHEFFFDRDYPEPDVLAKLYGVLTDQPQRRSAVEKQLSFDPELFEKAMEKLWISGGAAIDPEENITRGSSRWRPAYLGQREHKMAQLDDMTRYTQSHRCRMVNLVRHFGDVEDHGRPCGICDICEPESLTAQNLRPPDETEREILERIMEALRATNGLSTGKLFTAVLGGGSDERRQFESMLHGLSRAGLVDVRDRSFMKGEREIQFRLVELTAEGRTLEEPVAAFVTLPQERPKPARKRRAKSKAKTAKGRAVRAKAPAVGTATGKPLSAPGDEELFESLREWRLKEAKRKRVPAFQIMPDRVLRGIVAERPAVHDELLDIPGIGPRLAEKYGKKILEIVGGGSGRFS